MAKKQKGNPLESLLRYEIILALFALIGVYYFLTFSPVRMPRQTISSATIELPPTPTPAKKTVTPTSRAATKSKAAASVADGKKVPAAANSNPAAVKKVQAAPTAPRQTSAKPLKKPSLPVLPAAIVKGKATTPPTAGKKPAVKARHVVKAAPPTTASSPAKTAAPLKKSAAVRQPLTTAAPAKPANTTPAAANQRKPAAIKKPSPIRQSAAVTPPTPHKTPAARLGEKTYVIQAGIFIFPDTLKRCRQMLKEHGYTTFVTTKKRLLPMYRVFLGPYADLETARKIMKKIRRWGDDPFPCRRGNQYYVNVGSFYYQNTARGKIKQYRARGFKPVTFHEPVKVPHHILMVDGFSFDHYPRQALRSIQQLGIPDAFVRNWQP